jgi:hypothetical protein
VSVEALPVQPHPGHEALLERARFAPSAHNAQPWRLTPMPDGRSYELWYALADKLDADPDDRDGLIAVGAFYETLCLVSASSGFRCSFTPAVRTSVDGIILGAVAIEQRVEGGAVDPLSAHVDRRRTNRHRYARGPLPDDLSASLAALGCTFIDPARVAPLVARASIMAWRDRRFVDDLREWTRFDDGAADGLTCACLNLNLVDRLALRFALWRGRLPGWLAWVYARRDVALTKASAAVAVLAVDRHEPLDLFACGRRLVRAWITITAAGHAYHPISIVIDQQPTATELTALAGVGHAVAIFRVGYTDRPAVTSRRRGLDLVVSARGG